MKYSIMLIIMLLSLAIGANAQISGLDGKPSIDYSNNVIKNPSAKTNILHVTSSNLTVTRETGTKIDGVASFGLQASAVGGYFRPQMMPLPDQLKSGSCAFVGWFKGDASLYDAEVLDGSSNIIASLVLTNDPNGRYFQLPVSCGTTRTPQIVQRRSGAAPKIFVGQLTYTSGRGLIFSQADSPPINFTPTVSFSSGGATNYTLSATYERKGRFARIKATMSFSNASAAFSTPRLTMPSFLAIDTSDLNLLNTVGMSRGVIGGVGVPFRTAFDTSSGSIQISHFNTQTAPPVVVQHATTPSEAGIQAGDYLTWDVTLPIAGFTSTSGALIPEQTYDPFGDIVAPTRTGGCKPGSVPANGAAVSRTTPPYSRYFAEVGTTYGAGDGSTTFNLPNVSGISHRYVGSQTYGGETYTATLGQKRNDAMQAISGSMTEVFGGSVVSDSGVFSRTRTIGSRSPNVSGGNGWDTVNFSAGSGSETHGPDIAFHGCLVLVTTQAPAITGMVTSADASEKGRVEVINTIKTVSTHTTLTGQEDIVIVTGAATINLPSASLFKGKKYTIKNAYSGSINIASVDGSSQTLTHKNMIMVVQSNGSIWTAIDRSPARYSVRSYSLGASWYEVFNDGWVRQGGTVAAAAPAEEATVTFDIAFTNTNYSLSRTTLSSSSSTAVYSRVGAVTVSAGNFTSYKDAAIGFKWVAEGYGASAAVTGLGAFPNY